jgi:hypothetical protein
MACIFWDSFGIELSIMINKLNIMKKSVFLFFAGIKTKEFYKILFLPFLFFLSCSNQDYKPQVTCFQGEDYEYLENYNLPGTMCNDDLCVYYLKIWKEIFREKNKLTESYFREHIEVLNSGIHEWNDGISFRVGYTIKVDWAITYNEDPFIIKIEKNNTLYPSLNLPRDTYLEKGDILLAVDGRAFGSNIIILSNYKKLKFDSFSTALNHLIARAQVNTLCSGWMYIDRYTGNFILEAWAEFVNEDNNCIQGKIDLYTGETFVNETACRIF